jgi:hypothetical protein
MSFSLKDQKTEIPKNEFNTKISINYQMIFNLKENENIAYLVYTNNDEKLIEHVKNTDKDNYAILGYYAVYYNRYNFLKFFLEQELTPTVMYHIITGLFIYRIKKKHEPAVIKMMLLILKCKYMRSLYPKILYIKDNIENSNTYSKLIDKDSPIELKLRFVLLDMYCSINNGFEMLYSEIKKYNYSNSIWCFKVNFSFILINEHVCKLIPVSNEYPSVIAKSLEYGSKKDIKICIKLNEYLIPEKQTIHPNYKYLLSATNKFDLNNLKPVLSNFIIKNKSEQVFDYYVYFLKILTQIGVELPTELYTIIRKDILDMFINKSLLLDYIKLGKYRQAKILWEIVPEYFIKIYYDHMLINYIPDCIEFTYYNFSPNFISGRYFNIDKNFNWNSILDKAPVLQISANQDKEFNDIRGIYPYTYYNLSVKAKEIIFLDKKIYMVHDVLLDDRFKNRMTKLCKLHGYCKLEYNKLNDEVDDIIDFAIKSNTNSIWWPLHVYNLDSICLENVNYDINIFTNDGITYIYKK